MACALQQSACRSPLTTVSGAPLIAAFLLLTAVASTTTVRAVTTVSDGTYTGVTYSEDVRILAASSTTIFHNCTFLASMTIVPGCSSSENTIMFNHSTVGISDGYVITTEDWPCRLDTDSLTFRLIVRHSRLVSRVYISGLRGRDGVVSNAAMLLEIDIRDSVIGSVFQVASFSNIRPGSFIYLLRNTVTGSGIRMSRLTIAAAATATAVPVFTFVASKLNVSVANQGVIFEYCVLVATVIHIEASRLITYQQAFMVDGWSRISNSSLTILGTTISHPTRYYDASTSSPVLHFTPVCDNTSVVMSFVGPTQGAIVFEPAERPRLMTRKLVVLIFEFAPPSRVDVLSINLLGGIDSRTSRQDRENQFGPDPLGFFLLPVHRLLDDGMSISLNGVSLFLPMLLPVVSKVNFNEVTLCHSVLDQTVDAPQGSTQARCPWKPLRQLLLDPAEALPLPGPLISALVRGSATPAALALDAEPLASCDPLEWTTDDGRERSSSWRGLALPLLPYLYPSRRYTHPSDASATPLRSQRLGPAADDEFDGEAQMTTWPAPLSHVSVNDSSGQSIAVPSAGHAFMGHPTWDRDARRRLLEGVALSFLSNVVEGDNPFAGDGEAHRNVDERKGAFFADLVVRYIMALNASSSSSSRLDDASAAAAVLPTNVTLSRYDVEYELVYSLLERAGGCMLFFNVSCEGETTMNKLLYEIPQLRVDPIAPFSAPSPSSTTAETAVDVSRLWVDATVAYDRNSPNSSTEWDVASFNVSATEACRSIWVRLPGMVDPMVWAATLITPSGTAIDTGVAGLVPDAFRVDAVAALFSGKNGAASSFATVDTAMGLPFVVPRIWVVGSWIRRLFVVDGTFGQSEKLTSTKARQHICLSPGLSARRLLRSRGLSTSHYQRSMNVMKAMNQEGGVGTSAVWQAAMHPATRRLWPFGSDATYASMGSFFAIVEADVKSLTANSNSFATFGVTILRTTFTAAEYAYNYSQTPRIQTESCTFSGGAVFLIQNNLMYAPENLFNSAVTIRSGFVDALSSLILSKNVVTAFFIPAAPASQLVFIEVRRCENATVVFTRDNILHGTAIAFEFNINDNVGCGLAIQLDPTMRGNVMVRVLETYGSSPRFLVPLELRFSSMSRVGSVTVQGTLVPINFALPPATLKTVDWDAAASWREIDGAAPEARTTTGDVTGAADWEVGLTDDHSLSLVVQGISWDAAVSGFPEPLGPYCKRIFGNPKNVSRKRYFLVAEPSSRNSSFNNASFSQLVRRANAALSSGLGTLDAFSIDAAHPWIAANDRGALSLASALHIEASFPDRYTIHDDPIFSLASVAVSNRVTSRCSGQQRRGNGCFFFVASPSNVTAAPRLAPSMPVALLATDVLSTVEFQSVWFVGATATPHSSTWLASVYRSGGVSPSTTSSSINVGSSAPPHANFATDSGEEMGWLYDDLALSRASCHASAARYDSSRMYQSYLWAEIDAAAYADQPFRSFASTSGKRSVIPMRATARDDALWMASYKPPTRLVSLSPPPLSRRFADGIDRETKQMLATRYVDVDAGIVWPRVLVDDVVLCRRRCVKIVFYGKLPVGSLFLFNLTALDFVVLHGEIVLGDLRMDGLNSYWNSMRQTALPPFRFNSSGGVGVDATKGTTIVDDAGLHDGAAAVDAANASIIARLDIRKRVFANTQWWMVNLTDIGTMGELYSSDLYVGHELSLTRTYLPCVRFNGVLVNRVTAAYNWLINGRCEASLLVNIIELHESRPGQSDPGLLLLSVMRHAPGNVEAFRRAWPFDNLAFPLAQSSASYADVVSDVHPPSVRITRNAVYSQRSSGVLLANVGNALSSTHVNATLCLTDNVIVVETAWGVNVALSDMSNVECVVTGNDVKTTASAIGAVSLNLQTTGSGLVNSAVVGTPVSPADAIARGDNRSYITRGFVSFPQTGGGNRSIFPARTPTGVLPAHPKDIGRSTCFFDTTDTLVQGAIWVNSWGRANTSTFVLGLDKLREGSCLPGLTFAFDESTPFLRDLSEGYPITTDWADERQQWLKSVPGDGLPPPPPWNETADGRRAYVTQLRRRLAFATLATDGLYVSLPLNANTYGTGCYFDSTVAGGVDGRLANVTTEFILRLVNAVVLDPIMIVEWRWGDLGRNAERYREASRFAAALDQEWFGAFDAAATAQRVVVRDPAQPRLVIRRLDIQRCFFNGPVIIAVDGTADGGSQWSLWNSRFPNHAGVLWLSPAWPFVDPAFDGPPWQTELVGLHSVVEILTATPPRTFFGAFAPFNISSFTRGAASRTFRPSRVAYIDLRSTLFDATQVFVSQFDISQTCRFDMTLLNSAAFFLTNVSTRFGNSGMSTAFDLGPFVLLNRSRVVVYHCNFFAVTVHPPAIIHDVSGDGSGSFCLRQSAAEGLDPRATFPTSFTSSVQTDIVGVRSRLAGPVVFLRNVLGTNMAGWNLAAESVLILLAGNVVRCDPTPWYFHSRSSLLVVGNFFTKGSGAFALSVNEVVNGALVTRWPATIRGGNELWLNGTDDPSVWTPWMVCMDTAGSDSSAASSYRGVRLVACNAEVTSATSLTRASLNAASLSFSVPNFPNDPKSPTLVIPDGMCPVWCSQEALRQAVDDKQAALKAGGSTISLSHDFLVAAAPWCNASRFHSGSPQGSDDSNQRKVDELEVNNTWATNELAWQARFHGSSSTVEGAGWACGNDILKELAEDDDAWGDGAIGYLAWFRNVTRSANSIYRATSQFRNRISTAVTDFNRAPSTTRHTAEIRRFVNWMTDTLQFTSWEDGVRSTLACRDWTSAARLPLARHSQRTASMSWTCTLSPPRQRSPLPINDRSATLVTQGDNTQQDVTTIRVSDNETIQRDVSTRTTLRTESSVIQSVPSVVTGSITTPRSNSSTVKAVVSGNETLMALEALPERRNALIGVAVQIALNRAAVVANIVTGLLSPSAASKASTTARIAAAARCPDQDEAGVDLESGDWPAPLSFILVFELWLGASSASMARACGAAASTMLVTLSATVLLFVLPQFFPQEATPFCEQQKLKHRFQSVPAVVGTLAAVVHAYYGPSLIELAAETASVFGPGRALVPMFAACLASTSLAVVGYCLARRHDPRIGLPEGLDAIVNQRAVSPLPALAELPLVVDEPKPLPRFFRHIHVSLVAYWSGARTRQVTHIRLFSVEDMLVAYVVAFCTGYRPQSIAGCRVTLLLAAVVMAAHLAYLIRVKPYFKLVEQGFGTWTAVLQLVFVVACAASLRNDRAMQYVMLLTIALDVTFYGQLIVLTAVELRELLTTKSTPRPLQPTSSLEACLIVPSDSSIVPPEPCVVLNPLRLSTCTVPRQAVDD